jgi:hypothetical protein
MKQLSLILLLVGVTAVDTRTASSPAECTVAALQQKAPPGTITAAAVVPAEGTTPGIAASTERGNPGNTVNFRLGLPQAWNGKFFEGVAASAARRIVKRRSERLRRIDRQGIRVW